MVKTYKAPAAVKKCVAKPTQKSKKTIKPKNKSND
jgi:hypothetical protein